MRSTLDGSDTVLVDQARALAARVGGVHPPPGHLEGWRSRAAAAYAERAHELGRCLTGLHDALEDLAGRLARGC